MKMRRNGKTATIFFETLESRLALAGNVTVDPTAGTIIGDNSSNVIVVQQISATQIKVTGGGTKVNGSFSPQTFMFTGPDLDIEMNGGSDAVTLLNLKVAGLFSVEMGTGNDALAISGATVGDISEIDGGSGANAISIDKCTFNDSVGIFTGDNTDSIALTRSTIHGGLLVEMGNGTNALSMVSDNVIGVPDVSPVVVPFQDEIPIPDCGAIIEGGSGTDAVAMTSVTINCFTEIETEGGADSVAIANSHFGNLLEAIPSGQITSVGLCIDTGTGNDAVAIANTTVYGVLEVDTGGEVGCVIDDLDGSEATPAQVSNTSDGNDAVSLVKVNVLNALTEIPSDGGSEISPDVDEYVGIESGCLLIYTGNGSDAVALTLVNTDAEAAIYTTTGTTVTDNDGNDSVAIASSNFNRDNVPLQMDDGPLVPAGLFISTGNGNDAVSLAKVNVVGLAEIQTGAGTDHVAINALAADEIFADTGTGNYDTLAVANSSATNALFEDDGGIGDTLVRAHNHFIATSPPTNTPANGFEFVIG
jgi:large repetitive protein